MTDLVHVSIKEYVLCVFGYIKRNAEGSKKRLKAMDTETECTRDVGGMMRVRGILQRCTAKMNSE